MDSELFDCTTPISGSGHEDARFVRNRDPVGGMARAPRRRGSLDGPTGATAPEGTGVDALAALAMSLPAAARADCRERVEKRALASLADVSDPCICGEALLLVQAAEHGVGRAPAACFSRLGFGR